MIPPWIEDVHEESEAVCALMVSRQTFPHLMMELRRKKLDALRIDGGKTVQEVFPEGLKADATQHSYPIVEAPLMPLGIVAAVDEKSNVLAVYRVPLGRN